MAERLDIIIAENGGREVAHTIEGVGQSAEAAKGAVTGLKLAVAGLTNALSVLGLIQASVLTPIALLVGGAVAARGATQAFGDFESQMNATAVAADATTTQTRSMSESARRLALDWGVAATEVSGGFEELAKAGVDAQDIVDGAGEATIILSRAVGSDLPTAATSAAKAMKVFGFEAKDMNYVINQVAGTVNKSAFTMNDYMLALGQAGAVASTQRVPFSEFNAALAAVADQFTSGSDQGTSFRTFLLRLTPVTKEAKDAIRDLGLNFREADGSLRPIADIVDELQDKLGGLTDKSRGEALKTIFGEDSYRLAAVYLDRGGDAIRQFEETLIPAADAAEYARARLEGLWGALAKMKSAITELFIVIMEFGIGDVFTIIINSLTLAVRGLAAALKFLAPIIPILAARFTMLAASFVYLGLSNLAKGLLFVGRHLVALIPGLTKVNGLVRFSPFGLFTTMIVAAGLALYNFKDSIKLSRDGLITLGGYVEGTIQVIGSRFADLSIYVEKAMTKMSTDTKEKLTDLSTKSNSEYHNMLQGVAEFVRNSVYMFIGGINASWLFLKEFASYFVSSWKDMERLSTIAIKKMQLNFIEFVHDIKEKFAEAGDAWERFQLFITGKGRSKEMQVLKDLQATEATARRVADGVSDLSYEIATLSIPTPDTQNYDAFIEQLRTKLIGVWQYSSDEADRFMKDINDAARSLSTSTNNPPVGQLGAGTNTWSPDEDEESKKKSYADIMGRIDRELTVNTALLQHNSREREIQQKLYAVEDQLLQAKVRAMTGPERAALENSIRLYQARADIVKATDQITQQATGAMYEMVIQQQALNNLIAQGGPQMQLYVMQLKQLQMEMLQMKVNNGQGTFADGFLLELGRMLQGVEQFKARAGSAFVQFGSQMVDGFANSVGRAIVFSDNLGQSIMDIARNAVAELISSLVKMGIQWAINATIGKTVGAGIAAASIAEGAAVAAAWAPAAAATSLATLGTNSAVAISGMAAAYAAAGGFSLAAALGFKDGGLVPGAGGPRSDSVPARLSPGEFVVNAAATKRNLAQLQAMNAGRTSGGGGSVTLAPVFHITGADEPKKTAMEVTRELERALLPLLQKQMRHGGVLAGGN